MSLPPFAAIDFETANREPDSACALAIVEVRDGAIVGEHLWLLRPPRQEFVFTYLHGIAWADVAEARSFAEAWEDISAILRRSPLLIAHNASFDRRVMHACCQAAGHPPPSSPWLCTLELARAAWPEPRHALDKICAYLGIPLQHHRALSDARACAALVMRAGAIAEQRISLLSLGEPPPEEIFQAAPTVDALRAAGERLAHAGLPEERLAPLRHLYRVRLRDLQAFAVQGDP